MEAKRTQIYLRKDQYSLLAKQAAKRHVSMAELIRQAVDKFLAELSAKGAKRDSLTQIIGVGSSGLTDVSERHDLYLYGKGQNR